MPHYHRHSQTITLYDFLSIQTGIQGLSVSKSLYLLSCHTRSVVLLCVPLVSEFISSHTAITLVVCSTQSFLGLRGSHIVL